MNGQEGHRRVCILERGAEGFGFVLCCENDTTDTFVLRVLDDSPASEAGLRPGDRIVEINEVNVEHENHTDVVKILQGLKNIRLVVKFNKEANDYFMKPDNGMTVRPLPTSSPKLRPKVVRIRRGSTGYDFVVKTVGKSPRVCTGRYRQNMKGVTGHFVDTVDKGGQAFKAGLRTGERIVEINRISVERESHAYVISAIRTSPDHKLELLVVDKATDEFFSSHLVSPSYRHLYGDLHFAEVIDKSNYDISDGDMTPPVSPYSSSIVSETSTSTPISQRSPRLLAKLSSVEDLTGKTEELIQELRIHSAEITRLKSALGYSKSYVEPSMRDKYLNIITPRDASSNPGSPHFFRHPELRSTTSSSDDDHSLSLNNNHKPYTLSPIKPPSDVDDLSEVGFNVDLKTLKEHSQRQIAKKKNAYRDKVGGYDNYWVAHRAVNNM